MCGENLRRTPEYLAQHIFFCDHANRIKYSFSAAQLALGSVLRLKARADFIRGNPDEPADRREFSFGDSAGRDDMLLMLDRQAAICALIAKDLERDF